MRISVVLEWGRPALAGLNAVAAAVWEPAEQAAEELVYTDEMFEDVAPADSVPLVPGLLKLPTRQDLALRIGQWRAWFEWGSHNFADGSTVPPAWHLRGEDDPISLLAVGLDLDDLRNWLEREADPVTAKAVLWHYRPDTIPLSMARFWHHASFADTRGAPGHSAAAARTGPRRRAATRR